MRDGQSDLPDWRRASPVRIDRALQRALAKPSGGWYVLGASRALAPGPRRHQVDGRWLVAWRGADGTVRVAPDACPHMGASLARGRVDGACLVCPWHGLALGDDGHGAWATVPAHDDGVLVWARLGTAEEATPAPILPKRPDAAIDAVLHVEGRCEPRDVIANRLDPWHGVHFHPYSFAALTVTEATDDELRLEVTYRLGPIRFPVRATFACPEPRTIVMTITGGEGEGSVVETHATPVAPGRTAIIEATLASSPRRGFAHATRFPAPIRWAMRRAAAKLWVDDTAYAERLYALRQGEA
ncbi:DUF5914 domain-containing protein [soil metagenome]